MILLTLGSTFCFMNKDELRKVYLKKRLALAESEQIKFSQKICNLFFNSVDLSKIKVLHIYLPIKSKGEPNTWLIIDRIQHEFPEIRLVIPRVNGAVMENIFFEGPDHLEGTKWGMVEPKDGAHVDPLKIDLVITPLLVIDNQGHRIGYGKGFYDRFLKSCRPDCIKIGVSYFDPEPGIEEKSNHDVLLNACITPKEYLVFSSY